MAINLLPVKQKRLARSVYLTHRLIAMLIVGDLLLLSFIVLLAALHITIKQEKATNEKILISLGAKSQVIEFNQLRDEVGLVVKRADVAKDNIKSELLASDYLNQIISIRPSGVTLTNLDFTANEQDKIVLLTGVAGSRQNLLDFKSKLELLPWVSAVDSPVTNLVGDANSVFLLTVVLKNKP